MIRILYLCDSGVCDLCKKHECAHLGRGYCKHTSCREFSKNWKKATPTTTELAWFFEAIQDGHGFTYWEKERNNDRRRGYRRFER